MLNDILLAYEIREGDDLSHDCMSSFCYVYAVLKRSKAASDVQIFKSHLQQ